MRIDLRGSHVVGLRSREIDQIDVLVARVDAFDLDARRHDQLERVIDRQAAPPDQPRPYASFLAHLAYSRLVG